MFEWHMAMTVFELSSIIAIVLGPILAVGISLWLSKKAERKRRRYQIFSDLMRTRRSRLDQAHYSAINLIELEFYGSREISEAHRLYVELLRSYPKVREDRAAHQDRVNAQFAVLLQAIGKALGYHFDKSDLDRLGYLPEGVGNLQDDIAESAFLFKQMLGGERFLRVSGVSDERQPLKQIENSSSDLQSESVNPEIETSPRDK